MLQEDPSAPLTLLNIPVDIQLSIIDHLGYTSIAFLRATNHHFRHLLSDKQLSLARQRTIKALLQEEADDWNDYTTFICYECFKWKSWTEFGKKQMSKRRAKAHKDAYKSFCIECGIRRKKWQPGQFLKSEGIDIVLCRICRMLEPSDDETRLRGVCNSCSSPDLGQGQ